MKYRRYAEHKDSGIEWLGDIPYEWGTAPLRWYASVRSGDFVSNTDFDVYPSEALSVPVIGGNGLMGHTNKHNVPESTIVVGHVGALRGNVHQTTSSSWVTDNALILQITQGHDARYLWYALTALDLNRLSSQTAQPLVTGRLVKSQRLPLPTTSEQTRIAAFLDRETAQIDELIAKQERLIAVLQEKRQALISHAVTKGLNPDAPMKDSGVEWLREVPVHWGVKRLKHIAEIQTGVAKGRDLSGQDTIHVPYMRVANVQDGYLDLADVTTIEIARSELERYRPQAGDVLMNEGGDNDKLGRGHIWRVEIDPCIHQNHVFAVRPHGVEPEWLTLVTGADYSKFYFFSFAKQSTNLASISSSNLRELPVVCPPISERNEIRRHVAAESVKIDTLVQKAETAIGTLRERRAALISAAVTGKIDVRDIP